MEYTLMSRVGLSPSSEHNNVACPTTASVHELSSSSAEITPRKKARRKQKRKGRKKVEKKKEKKRQRHRTPSGVPEQESGCSLVQILVRGLVNLHVTFVNRLFSLQSLNAPGESLYYD